MNNSGYPKQKTKENIQDSLKRFAAQKHCQRRYQQRNYISHVPDLSNFLIFLSIAANPTMKYWPGQEFSLLLRVLRYHYSADQGFLFKPAFPW